MAQQSLARNDPEGERGMARSRSGLSLFDWMFDRMQRDFFGSFDRLAHLMAKETDRELVVTAELPGIKPEDVQIECKDDRLIVRGETHDERATGGGGEVYASFYGELRLPTDVDVDEARADLKNGLLRIRFPKSSEQSVKRIQVTSDEGKQQKTKAA